MAFVYPLPVSFIRRDIGKLFYDSGRICTPVNYGLSMLYVLSDERSFFLPRGLPAERITRKSAVSFLIRAARYSALQDRRRFLPLDTPYSARKSRIF